MDILNPHEHIPWITFEAKDWLDGVLSEDMTGFEWGSGGSTLYFGSRIQRLVSVEHDLGWFQAVEGALAAFRINTVDYLFRPPRQTRWAKYLPYHQYTYVSRTFPQHRDCCFRSYAKAIQAYPVRTFDFVFVDGRTRIACMHLALSRIKKGGYLILDNSERADYAQFLQTLRRFERIDFFGKGPRLVEPWQTTAWRIG